MRAAGRDGVRERAVETNAVSGFGECADNEADNGLIGPCRVAIEADADVCLRLYVARERMAVDQERAGSDTVGQSCPVRGPDLFR